ncbi:MAG: hypothetical protein RSE56_02400 [Bacilli bacterium]
MNKRILIIPMMIGLLSSCGVTPTTSSSTTTSSTPTPPTTTTPIVKTGVKIEGEVNAAFEKVSDTLYIARNIEVLTDSKIIFKNYLQPSVIVYDGQAIERNLCNAKWDYAPSSYKGEYQVVIAGGAKYDFICDLSRAQPISIRRTEVVALPSDATTLRNLFPTLVGNVSLCNINDINSIVFEDKVEESIYNFKIYEDNKTFANVKSTKDESYKGIIYRSFTGDKLKEVDTFLGDSTKTAYSKTYKVADALPADHVRDNLTTADAKVLLNSSYFNQLSFGDIFLDSYGYGFGEGTGNTLKITSVKDENGSFTTTITSKKEGDDGYYVYLNDVIVKFNKDGTLTSGSYLKKSFTSEFYDFSKHEFKPGYEAAAVKKLDMNIAITLSDKLNTGLVFDETPYFIKTISDIKLQDAGCVPAGQSGNFVQQGNTIEFKENKKGYSFAFTPTSALDSKDYKVIASSAADIIKEQSDYKFVAVKAGVSELTLGNGTSNDVTAKTNVTVVNNIKVSSFYMLNNGDDDGAVFLYIAAGDVVVSDVAASPYKAPNEFTPIASTTDYADVSRSPEGKLIIDTSKAKQLYNGTELTFTITMDSPNYALDASKTVFTIHIGAAWNEGVMLGKWLAPADGDYFMFNNDGTGTFYLHNYFTGEKETIVSFTFEKGKHYSYKVKAKDVVIGTEIHEFSIQLFYNPKTNSLKFNMSEGVYGTYAPSYVYGDDMVYVDLVKA